MNVCDPNLTRENIDFLCNELLNLKKIDEFIESSYTILGFGANYNCNADRGDKLKRILNLCFEYDGKVDDFIVHLIKNYKVNSGKLLPSIEKCLLHLNHEEGINLPKTYEYLSTKNIGSNELISMLKQKEQAPKSHYADNEYAENILYIFIYSAINSDDQYSEDNNKFSMGAFWQSTNSISRIDHLLDKDFDLSSINDFVQIGMDHIYNNERPMFYPSRIEIVTYWYQSDKLLNIAYTLGNKENIKNKKIIINTRWLENYYKTNALVSTRFYQYIQEIRNTKIISDNNSDAIENNKFLIYQFNQNDNLQVLGNKLVREHPIFLTINDFTNTEIESLAMKINDTFNSKNGNTDKIHRILCNYLYSINNQKQYLLTWDDANHSHHIKNFIDNVIRDCIIES